MEESILVRDVKVEEYPRVKGLKTGATLSDGSILLWRSDMDRMGLERLRQWIESEVIQREGVLAVAEDETGPTTRLISTED